MKATFSVKHLRDAVNSVSSVSVSKVKDLLKCVKISAGQSVTISATDSEVSIVRTIPEVEVRQAGDVLFDCTRLISILREVTGDTITVDVENGIAAIKSGGAKFNIPTKDARDFPPSPVFDSASYYTISAKDMGRIVQRCIFADQKNQNASVGGVLIDVEDGKLFGMSMDGNSLSLVEAVASLFGDAPAKIVSSTPMKAIKLVGAILENQATIDICITTNSIQFRTSDTVIGSQQLTGKPHNWRRHFANEKPIQIPVVPSVLASALRQCMITTAEESKRINFTLEKGVLRLQSAAADVGDSEVEVPIQFDGTLKLSIIPDYLLTALKLVDAGSMATLGLTDSENPIRLNSDCGLKYIQAVCEVK